MGRKARNYDPDFKEYLCKLVVQDGRRMVDLSRELDVPYSSLEKWVTAYKKRLRDAEKNKQKQLKTATEYKADNETLTQENIELREELEILKKAMRIFTQEKN